MVQKNRCRVINIVASTNIHQKLDLGLIKNAFPNVKYNPLKYSRLVYKINTPKVTLIVSQSGKIIFMGAKKVQEIEKARNQFYTDLKKVGYILAIDSITIQNIVIQFNIGKKLDLVEIVESNKKNYLDYEPEIFPGIIYKNKSPRFTALIFSTGVVIIEGLKELKNLSKKVECVKKIVIIADERIHGSIG